MAFLKKSIFLVLFLGLVSLSICDKEKREAEEDENKNEEEIENHEEKRQDKPFGPPPIYPVKRH
uniref:Baltikinin n=1 Tax=Callimedusa baltea TaxID=3371531 RepID=A0A1B5FYM1_9NEOB|nr:Baltikinin precursor [Phyllomedusa baltea]